MSRIVLCLLNSCIILLTLTVLATAVIKLKTQIAAIARKEDVGPIKHGFILLLSKNNELIFDLMCMYQVLSPVDKPSP